MGWYEAIMAIAALVSAGTTVYSASQADNSQPVLPGYVPPDLGPIREQEKYTRFQDKTRRGLLNEYYGNGLTPYMNYSSAQNQINDDMIGQLPADLVKYYADRGISETDQITAGAREELGKTWNQRRFDVNAKSHDIYALTLGSLLGEVSDAGMQTAQMAGALGQANQMENLRRDQSYASAMQKWQYDQSQPTTAGTIGSLLPSLMMLGGNIYSGYNSGGYGSPGTNPGQLGYNAGSGGSNWVPPGRVNTTW